jgi:molybdate transport system substrate-binding protein
MRTFSTWIAVCLLFAWGCRSGSEAPAKSSLSIFAASSLTEAFGELADAFSKTHGIKPTLAFAGSQVLRLQIEHGARADVFASANADHMRALVSDGRVADPEIFAYNELVVIIPKQNPASIRSFLDLPRARRLVVGAPEVPVGMYTQTLLHRAEAALGADFAETVRSHIVSEESNVRLVRAKVELGEADAALVYRTDVSGDLITVEVPAELAVRASYHIGLIEGRSRGELARRWIDFVKSSEGQAILSKHGFLTP